MTDRATLLALAERVEKAEGPDRELDAEIDLYLSLPEITRRGGVALVSDGGIHEWYGPGPPAPQRNPATGTWRAPRMKYTASLNAALTLVRSVAGFIATMGDLAADGLPGVCICVSTDPVRHVWGVSRAGSDEDGRLARAATAAALRAQAEEMPE